MQQAKDEIGDILVKVFENGYLLKEYTFEDVRINGEVKFTVKEHEEVC